MRIITEREVTSIVNYNRAIRLVETAHRHLAQGKASNAVRVRVRAPKFSLHTLSASSIELGLAAVKSYSAGPAGMQSHVLLYEISSARLLAIIEANDLGRLRTAATSVLAAKALLNDPSPRKIALIGSGYQAAGALEAYATEFPNAALSVYSRDDANRTRFADSESQLLQREIFAAPSGADAVEAADIVVTVTTSSQPVLDRNWLLNTRHVSALGSNALSRRELPSQVVASAGCIVVDTIDVARVESGNLLPCIESGRVQWEQVRELGEVLESGFRAPNGSYSLFCSHGLAVQDLYLAAEVYRLAEKTDSRTVSEKDSPKE